MSEDYEGFMPGPGPLDGRCVTERREEVVRTLGDLRRLTADLPDDTPVQGSFDFGYGRGDMYLVLHKGVVCLDIV